MVEKPTPQPARRGRGFRAAADLIARPLRTAGERRGFAVDRLLTRWEEVVGPETARIARPIKVSYAQGGFGATLVVLTTGAQAPMLQMQEARLRERINACYGYAAISRIRFTQTAPTGFAEGQAAFAGAAPRQPEPPAPEIRQRADALVAGVDDPELREALSRLGSAIIDRRG